MCVCERERKEGADLGRQGAREIALLVVPSADSGTIASKAKNAKSHGLAHREGRTRSLQIAVMVRPCTRHKSLTLYPIELGGR